MFIHTYTQNVVQEFKSNFFLPCVMYLHVNFLQHEHIVDKKNDNK
jgi:hypothetical protein